MNSSLLILFLIFYHNSRAKNMEISSIIFGRGKISFIIFGGPIVPQKFLVHCLDKGAFSFFDTILDVTVAKLEISWQFCEDFRKNHQNLFFLLPLTGRWENRNLTRVGY